MTHDESDRVINPSDDDWRSFVPLDGIRKNSSHTGIRLDFGAASERPIRNGRIFIRLALKSTEAVDTYFLTFWRGTIRDNTSYVFLGYFPVEYRRREAGDKSLTGACIHRTFS